jgi:bifunctional UDP-N-acetylglucosamine pyrophosphorylase/glucosamine-1-phosphate N-acetyltransferase
MNLEVVILAAGRGTRMKTKKAKVLHTIAGKPLLKHVIDTAKSLNPFKIHIVYGYQGEEVNAQIDDSSLNWVQQKEQLGTGDALKQVLNHISKESQILVLYGDVPLLSKNTLEKLIEKKDLESLALLTATLDHPYGLGRIVRDKENNILKIVEQKDATNEQKTIKEIFTGFMLIPYFFLKQGLSKLNNQNAQNEYYLTDLVKIAVEEKVPVISYTTLDIIEIQGVNDLNQLNYLERTYQKRKAEDLLKSGVYVADKARIDIRGSLNCAPDVTIDINCVFVGNNHIERDVEIGPNCLIKNAFIKRGTKILANSIIEDSIVGESSVIGPFARLRPGCELDKACKVGNFVEMKMTVMGVGSKANHLSYIGDSIVGSKVNIGAGTITCNYDGANKHQTIIKDNAFIGSGTELVAPVEVGESATIGAGTTLRKNAPADELTLSIKQSKTIQGWQRPVKK